MSFASGNTRVRQRVLVTFSALAGAMTATAVTAQATDKQGTPEAAENANQGYKLEEIVVTAQKREQNLQSVPIAVTALLPQTLSLNRVTNLGDLASIAPGVTVRNVPGGLGEPQIVIRGSLSSSNFAGQDHSISLNIDGVYIGSPYGNAFDIPDLERVEVLRGPQGTLFGRNSNGGALNFITRDPSGEFHVHQQTSVGNYGQLRNVTRIELPAMGPFSAYVTYLHDERDGDTKNLASGIVWDRSNSARYGLQTSPTRLGDKDSDGVRAALKFAPTNNFEMVYKFDHVGEHFTPEATALVVFKPENFLNYGVPPAFVQAIADAVNALPNHGLEPTQRPNAVYNGFVTPGYTQTSGHTLRSTLGLGDNLTVKNITAWRETSIYSNSDYAGLGQPLHIFGNPTASYVTGGSFDSFDSQFSSELQLNYTSKLVTLTVGSLYFRERSDAGTDAGLMDTTLLTFVPLPGNVLPPGLDRNSVRSQSIAGFGQAELHVTDKLNLIGGARVTHDRKRGVSYVSTVPFPIEYEQTEPTFDVGANYQLDPDVMIYGKFSTGFISGGAISNVPFAPEKAQSWEVGVKSDLFERRVRFNVASYFVKYQDVQTTVLGNQIGHPEVYSVVASLGNATVKGVEVELTAVPLRGLTLDAALTYSDFKYTKVNPVVGVGDYPVWLRPTWTGNLGVEYETLPIVGNVNLMFRIEGDYVSHITSPGFFVEQPGYEHIFQTGNNAIFNARAALQNIAIGPVKGEVALYARNLFNNKEPLFGLFNGFGASTNYQPARTYGVEVTVDF
ncbi:MAG TPA: TonB-dependent receptor [Steroidobacteraceae bacterium]|nr:TonB-dependent receptor [Steroidobacteraceae bacterium]